jgi:hypothetical protein
MRPPPAGQAETGHGGTHGMRSFDRLDWRARLKMDTVRLVIPLAVVDELDGKKYARRDEFQQRARELLTLIDRYETSAPDAYVELRLVG